NILIIIIFDYFLSMILRPTRSTLFPYTTLFRSLEAKGWRLGTTQDFLGLSDADASFIEFKLKLAQSLRAIRLKRRIGQVQVAKLDRKSTRLNSSHVKISYAVFCLKKKNKTKVQK